MAMRRARTISVLLAFKSKPVRFVARERVEGSTIDTIALLSNLRSAARAHGYSRWR